MGNYFHQFLIDLFTSAKKVTDLTALDTQKCVSLHLSNGIHVYLFQDAIEVYDDYDDTKYSYYALSVTPLPEKLPLTTLGWYAAAHESGFLFDTDSPRPRQLWAFLEMLKQGNAWVDFYKPNRVFWKNRWNAEFHAPLPEILYRKLLRYQNNKVNNRVHRCQQDYRLESLHSEKSFELFAYTLPSDIKAIVASAINDGCKIDYHPNSGFGHSTCYFNHPDYSFAIESMYHIQKRVITVWFSETGEDENGKYTINYSWEWDYTTGKFLGQKESKR